MLRPLACCLVALSSSLAAQAPAEVPVWPVDLEAIAKKLEVTPLPAVLDQLPEDYAQRLREAGAMLSPAEVEDALDWGPRGGTVIDAVIVRVSSQSDGERANAAGLWREIRACYVWSTKSFEDTMREASGRPPSAHRAAAEPARNRQRGLGARLLREHPSDPLVGTFLATFDGDLGLSRTDQRRCAERSVELRGASASADSYLLACRCALADLDVAAAKRWLAAAVVAPMPACVAGRSSVGSHLFELRNRIAEAERLFAATAESPLDEQILRVRRLQQCDGSAAIEECRRLIVDDVPHALPYSVLAAKWAAEFNFDPAARLLARARAQPGRDFHTVVAMANSQFLPMLPRPPESDEQREQVQSDFEAMMRTGDEILAGDPSESARLFAWLRTEAAFPQAMSLEALGRGLPAARDLQRDLPASLAAYLFVLVGARLSSDDAAARDTLRAPIPEALAGLDVVVRLRAEVSLQRHLVAGGNDMDTDLEHAFADLERVQQDACEANYLRGVLLWSRGIRAGDETLLRKARDLFVAARRPRSEAGWWRAASALCVANTMLGDEDGLGELLDQSALRDDPSPHIGVSLLASGLLGAQVPPWLGEMAERAAAQQGGGVSALRVATAAGRAARGDGDGAREAARLALRALDDLRDHDLGPDTGVACESEFKCLFVARTSRAEIDVQLRCDLWILPKLPDRARLQALADGK